MFVPTMTPEEICKEIDKDYPAFHEKVVIEKERVHRKFIKAILFPVLHQYTWKSSLGNKWNVILLARYRNERKIPALIPYLKYENKGLGIIYPKHMYGRVCKINFCPHFFKRYRERMLEPNDLTGLSFDEQIKHFFLNCGLFTMDFRENENNGQIHFMGCTKNGVFFGVVLKDIDYICVKTYVPANMLFENQIEVLNNAEKIREMILSSPEYFRTRGKSFHINEDFDSFYLGE